MDLKPKSQITAEFVILAGFAVMMSAILLSVAMSQLNDLYDSRTYILMRDIALKIQNEIMLASEVRDGYCRNFELPADINNKDYKVWINGTTLTVKHEGLDYNLVTLNVEGVVDKGINRIKKKDGVIEISPYSPVINYTFVTVYNSTYGLTIPFILAEEDLILLMHFDNKSEFGETTEGIKNKTYDFSKVGNNGTIYGANFSKSEGITGGAFLFESRNLSKGMDYIKVGTKGLNQTRGTISAWFNPRGFIDIDGVPKEGLNHYIYGLTTIPAYANRIQIYISGINTSSGNLNIGMGNNHTAALNVSVIDINKWYNVVLSWNATDFSVFLNSEFKRTGKFSGFSIISKHAHIGNTGENRTDVPRPREAFNGTIDEFAIWNRTLRPDNISYTYNYSNFSLSNC